MDFTLPAWKVLCFQLRHAVSSSPPSDIVKVATVYGIRFQCVWIQGVLVSVSPPDENSQRRAVMDDGTGVAEVIAQSDQSCEVGMYVMAVGKFIPPAADHAISLVEVHKMVDLSSYPDREAIWNLEVIEANNLFYNQKTAKRVSRFLKRLNSEWVYKLRSLPHLHKQPCLAVPSRRFVVIRSGFINYAAQEM